MAGPIIPAMPLATALVLGIPSYWPWHSSCCWNVTAADRCAVAAVHVHAAAAAISVPAAAAIAAAATRDAAGAILATDEPKARWAWPSPSSKKSGPRMPFLAAYLPRLSEVYSRTYECRASFRPATRGMVEVSPKVYRRMTPFWQLHPNWPLQGDSH